MVLLRYKGVQWSRYKWGQLRRESLVVVILVLLTMNLLGQGNTNADTSIIAANTALSVDTGRTGNHGIPIATNIQDTATASTAAQNDSLLHYNKFNGPYLLSIPQSFAYTVSRPFNWKGRDWARAGITLGTIGTIFLLDDQIKSVVQANRTRGIDKVFNTVEPFGNRYAPYLLAGMFVTGSIIKNDRLTHVALGATRSLIVSTAIYTSLKGVARRMRPDTASGPYVFAGPFKTGYTSFPSGHTNTIFSVATAIALEYKDVKWVPIVSYTIAGLTGMSRIVQNRHWASDVVTGAVIGHFTARAVDAWERRQGYKRKPFKQVM